MFARARARAAAAVMYRIAKMASQPRDRRAKLNFLFLFVL